MYLKAITMKGFKSFPDRTRMEFGPGVSVIVGPNGSGKSNVTDAVLWALGEQSPVAVRGHSMQDVIFGGAPGRQAARAAEVELILDDSEGRLGLPSPEVSIVRRLERSGEGEYRLAGARCRLVDVLEVLSDTGLGKEMHSVISQGRVEAIVTSKPRDRRLLIEEAAGLGKHRKRRRRAQLKLARTQDNLDRALDVEREARSRLRPLKRQAEAAEIHARLERQMLEVRWQLARDRMRHELEALTAAERAAHAERERRAHTEQALSEVATQRERAEEALAARSARREELSRRAFAAGSAADRIELRAEAVRAALSSLARRLEQQRTRLGGLESEDAEDRPDPEAPARLAALQSELEALEQDRDAELARQLAALERELGAAGAERGRLEEAVEQARAVRQDSESGLERARERVREAERAVEVARREAARVGGELAAVNQFLRSHAAAPGGAASLADSLDVDPGFEVAVAAALDGRLGAAVVGDVEAGAGLLDRAGLDGGRVLVSGAEAAAVPPPGTPEPVPGARRLLDHVRGAAAARQLAELLLQDAWLIEDLGTVPSGFGGLAVTAQGRVWAGATRELRQAPAHGEERVLAERNRRSELVAATAATAGAEHTARGELARATEQLAALEEGVQQATGAHRAAVRTRDEAAEAERRLKAQIERRRSAPDEGPGAARRAQLSAELAAERAATDRAARERAERQGRLGRVRSVIARGELLLPALREVLSSLSEVVAAVAARRAVFEAALAEDRQAGEQVAAELRACAGREANLQSELGQINESLTRLEVGAQRVRDSVADARGELTEVGARLDLIAEAAEQPLSDEEREDLRMRLERLARRKEQLGPVNPLAAEEYAEAVEHVEELERQRGDLEGALRELHKLIADTDRQIRETFEQTFDAAARNFQALVTQLFPGGEGRLRLVSEREGPVPVLGGQELAPAGQTGGTAAGSDPGAEEEDPAPAPEEDLLGVEIEITPAGKAMKRLSLLSGGEKSMTALAFLFSVFLAKPCPFYILDEVEAALDDLNINRFLELLSQYSERAQFIVVTHQKRTMEAADSLYGVSMGGDGISKVISRRLPRAA